MAEFIKFLSKFNDSFEWNQHEEELSVNVQSEIQEILEASRRLNLERVPLKPIQEPGTLSSFHLEEKTKDYGLSGLLPFLKLESLECGELSVGSIIGSDESALGFSDKIALKIYVLGEGREGSPWGSLADEFIFRISGNVSMGAENLTNEEERYRRFHSSEPRFIRSLTDESSSFLGISFQWGRLGDPLWSFKERDHNVYDETIMAISNVKDYYDDFASKYEANMKKWGYFLPRLVFESFKKGIEPQLPPGDSKILDLGCGDGLIGQEFHKEGYTNLIGFDFSSSMLAKSKEKKIYKDLHQGDLLKELPFNTEGFDLLLCISVTTYINPSVLEEWIRVIAPGGYLIFSHKSSVSPSWEPRQKELEDKGLWSLTYVTDPPVMFLPLLKEGSTQKPCEEKAKIYVYQRNKFM